MTSTLEDATVEHRQAIDQDRVFDYLVSNNLASPTDKLVVKSFSHGQSNPTYLLELPSKRYVLRRAPPGKIVSPTAHRVDREYRLMKALKQAPSEFPVPEVYSLCQDTHVLGSSFYIMEFCQGRLFKEPGLPQLNGKPQDKKLVWFSAIDTLAKLHDLDVDQVGLSDFGPQTRDYFKRQIKTLIKVSDAQFQVDPTQVPELKMLKRNGQKIGDLIDVDFDEPRPCVVHGDYKMDNLLIHATQPQVMGVIDWEMATIGTFGADLANLLIPFYIPNDSLLSTTVGAIQEDEAKELPSRDDLLRRYCESRMHPKMDFQVLRKRIFLFIAFQCFKFGVILQGVASRSVKGQASSAMAAIIGQLAPEFDKLSTDFLETFSRLSSSKL